MVSKLLQNHYKNYYSEITVIKEKGYQDHNSSQQNMPEIPEVYYTFIEN